MELEIIGAIVGVLSLGVNGYLALRQTRITNKHEEDLQKSDEKHQAQLEAARAEYDLKVVEKTEAVRVQSEADDMVFSRMKEIVQQYETARENLLQRVADYERNEEQLQQQIDTLRKRVEHMEELLGIKTQEANQLREANGGLQDENQGLQDRVADLLREIENMQALLDGRDQKLQEVTDELDELKASVRLSEGEKLERIAELSDEADRAAQMYETVKAKYDDLRARAADFEKSEKLVESMAVELNSAKAKLVEQSDYATLKRKIAESDLAVSNAKADLAAKEAKIGSLENAKDEFAELLRVAREALAEERQSNKSDALQREIESRDAAIAEKDRAIESLKKGLADRPEPGTAASQEEVRLRQEFNKAQTELLQTVKERDAQKEELRVLRDENVRLRSLENGGLADALDDIRARERNVNKMRTNLIKARAPKR